jgi:signal transduction histidine kinase/CheY-like chemotaxis protein
VPIAHILQFGPALNAKSALITLTFATMLFVGERAGWITVAAIAGFLSLLGVFVTQGYLVFNFDYQAHILKPQTWIGIVFNLTVYSAITGYIAMLFLQFLQNLLAQSRAQAEALREAKDKIEAADRAKQQFLANISHELNTPLNTILGSLNVLQDKGLTLAQRNTLATVRHSSEHLHQLVNNILDAARLERQQLLLNPTPIRLSDLLQHIANMIQIKAQHKGLQFILVLPESLPTTVNVDELRLRQILLNLLVNAVKYTPEGYVKLTLVIQQENPQKAQFEFSVEDSGIGIPLAEQERLLRPFERGQTLEQPGAGLGLNIVSQLLRQMDSCLMIADVFPQGSRFSFTVKLAVWNWHNTTEFSTTLTELPTAPPLDTLQQYWQSLLLGRLPVLKHQLEALAQDTRYQLFANEALNLIHSEQKKLLQRFLQQFFPQEIAMPALADIAFTASLEQPVVLIIDDDDFNIYLVAHYLRDFRFEILSANNGLDGLQLAVRTQPQIILLDIYMPGLNGFETCQQLKADPSTQAIPVIFFSASSRSEDLTAAFTQQGQDYLLKPLREEEVIARTTSCLQRHVLQQPLLHRLAARQEELEETEEDFDHRAAQLVDKLYKFRKSLLENLAEKPHLDELAREIGLNRNRLNEEFRLLFGDTIFAWLREQRLQKARRLLQQTTLSIQTIAENTGHPTLSAFSRTFKQRFGQSPQEYRVSFSCPKNSENQFEFESGFAGF